MNASPGSVPAVSVLMGVFNCEPYLEESVVSIIEQTMESWELILCDDGSTDGTLDLANAIAATDPRIRVLRNDYNRGLAWTLNRAAGHARAGYFARQDGDDRSTPDRLAKELEFLESNPAFDIVSTGMTLFDEEGCWGSISNIEWPMSKDFVTRSPFSHAASMVRRSAFEAVGGYRHLKRTWRVEDYDLWFRMYELGFRGHNIQECLYEVRDGRDAWVRRKFRYRFNETWVRLDGFRRLGLSPLAYPSAMRPIAVGLVPSRPYRSWRRRRYGTNLPGRAIGPRDSTEPKS